MRDLVLTDARELRRTLPKVFQQDRFLLANFAHREVAMLVTSGRTTVLRVNRRGSAGIVGYGDIGAVVELIERNAERIGPVDHALLPYGTEETWPGRVAAATGLATAPPWVWLFCTTAPPHQPGEEMCRILPPEELGEVAELLREANPIAMSSPEDESLAWWGYRDEQGALLSVCAVEFQEDPGWQTGFGPRPGQGVRLSGFGTHPDARGRGIGRAMMAAMTRWGVREHGFVHYGVWMDNEDAVRLYRRLGYQVSAEIQMYRR
nr:GNAT family N-acetyltransferase [Actinomycetales bacterium]